MLFCDPCSVKQGWPRSEFKIYRRCEICAKYKYDCNDIDAALLPA